jgi:hypothetical protein
MNLHSIEQLTAFLLLIDFLCGITFGVVGGAVIGSRRGVLTWPDTDGPVSAGARTIYGIYLRGYLRDPLPGDGQPSNGPRTDDDPASPGQEAGQ